MPWLQNIMGNGKSTASANILKWYNFAPADFLPWALGKAIKSPQISNNRPEWNFADMGMASIGVVHVPVYPTISDDEFRYILSHSGAKMLIVSDKSLYEKLLPITASIDTLDYFYTFNQIEGAHNFNEIIDLGRLNFEKYRDEAEKIKSGIDPDDIVSIIYTSGTTGISKGVMLSHNNIVSNVKASDPKFDIPTGFRVLSFLPLCHIFERMVNYIYQYKGGEHLLCGKPWNNC
jgi:long-chain acyl-CoA synthetase